MLDVSGLEGLYCSIPDVHGDLGLKQLGALGCKGSWAYDVPTNRFIMFDHYYLDIFKVDSKHLNKNFHEISRWSI